MEETNMHHQSKALALALACGLSAATAQAALIESEANDSIGTANTVVSANSALAGMIGDGTLNLASNDVDMFAVKLVAGQLFSASIDSTISAMVLAGTDLDLGLVLLDADSMHSLSGNHDGSFNTSLLEYTPTETGWYYLAITAQGQEALDTNGDPMRDFFNWDNNAFASWSDGAWAAGSYNVSLTGNVPEPASPWLLAAGALAAVASRVRKSSRSV
jgi:hypothetical protein